ncbi:efflux transporter outer membrane subunit [Pedosphaera parvula]|uniref:RND efflux system, outer membrane lipoprotein, NodT family n=1 Tax=Pedosphaera parvula (strain Ellin514) TaxID=320771 RepID=B9XML8_PEDPL|nr:efflux transporter outer membrane subunit [Pedosphaera parvula]EEF58917.1 RND efflux system, outer membrane lipoprotein, NodT family [Pedosphaera parvula Ellin514]
MKSASVHVVRWYCNQLFALMGATLVLGGCMVGPDYKRPEATRIPATYAGATNHEWKVAEPRAHLPKGNWWEMFGDPELNRLEAEAASANQQLKAAFSRLEEARAITDITRSGLFPNVALSGEYTRQRTSPNQPSVLSGNAIGKPSTFNDFLVPLNLNYEVDLWGRVRRSVESARAQESATADDLGTIQLIIQAEVAADYVSLRSLDTEYAIVRSTIGVFRKSLDLTLDRRAGGIVSDLDVAQAETVYRTARAQLPAIALQRAQFQHALAVLIGKPASSFAIPERALRATPPVIPPGLPSELLERRPDIAATERRMAAANASIGVAKAAFFPTVRLNGMAGLESVNAGTVFNWSSRFWSVGPSLTLPIFEGGALRANLRFTKATYDETVADYRQIVLTAFRDVEDNLSAQTLLASEYEEQAGALQSANRQLEIANDRYHGGLVTYLEVATAQNLVLGLERTVVQLRGQQLVTAVALVQALGGGWQPIMDDGASSKISALPPTK